jgi:hypothetical protein
MSQRQRKEKYKEVRGYGVSKGTPATTAKYDLRGVMVVEGEIENGTTVSSPVSESRGTGGAAPLKMPAKAKLSQESVAEVSGGASQEGKWAKQAIENFGGYLCPLTFGEKATLMREQCMAEIEHEQSEAKRPVTLTQEKPLSAVPKEQGLQQRGEWMILSMAVDSGASETVIPHALIKGHPVRATDASRGGLNYASATGDPIPNLGEQKLPLVTMEGTLRAMTFQAAPVAKPLGSVKRMCDSGHTVVFDDDGSYVQNKTTGEINWLREESGQYMLDAWVMPMAEVARLEDSFRGQP